MHRHYRLPRAHQPYLASWQEQPHRIHLDQLKFLRHQRLQCCLGYHLVQPYLASWQERLHQIHQQLLQFRWNLSFLCYHQILGFQYGQTMY